MTSVGSVIASPDFIYFLAIHANYIPYTSSTFDQSLPTSMKTELHRRVM